MVFLAPIVHSLDDFGRLEHDLVVFSDGIEIEIRNHHGDFEDSVFDVVKPGHFEVDPKEVFFHHGPWSESNGFSEQKSRVDASRHL
jgi:hypothetical protein